MQEAERERAELLSLLLTLEEGEWRIPSLCAGWSVRDVVAHLLSYEGLGMREVASRMARGRLMLTRTNAIALQEYRDATPDELVQRLRTFPRPTGLTAGLGGGIGLVDGVIHQQDIRRPLHRPRFIDAERLRYALKFTITSPALRGFWKVRGVRVIATDVDWAYGRGPEARGPGEAVLLAMAGRRDATHDLVGPGREILQRRLGGGVAQTTGGATDQ
jgi:uncharacterized protein (TIGR03083 family)